MDAKEDRIKFLAKEACRLYDDNVHLKREKQALEEILEEKEKKLHEALLKAIAATELNDEAIEMAYYWFEKFQEVSQKKRKRRSSNEMLQDQTKRMAWRDKL